MHKDRTGETNVNKQGLKMWIKEYRGRKDIDIEFEDGYIVYNREYADFKKKEIRNLNFKQSNLNDRTGEIVINNHGSKAKIIKYNNVHDIVIKFDNGYIYNTSYSNFKKGNIKSPYCKTVYNIGYLGEGKYTPRVNNKKTKSYECWCDMLKRCGDENYKKVHTTYKDVACCEEWLNFQVFAEWYEENYYEVSNQRMNLDKDILYKHNKVYSPTTCIFVPQSINKIFTKSDAIRGDYPIGVTYNKHAGKFASQYKRYENNNSTTIFLGYFNTIDEAHEVYKIKKEKYIKEIAEIYKDNIPKELYEALYRYEVEITD